MADRPLADDRAMSPVVGKAMEATLVVLYLGLVTTALYGGAVPEYRTEAGAEVADRTVAAVATDLESAIPPNATAATVRLDRAPPATIADAAYRIHATPEELVLEHPNPAVTTTTPLVLPNNVVRVTGTWRSGDTLVVRVERVDGGLEVRLS